MYVLVSFSCENPAIYAYSVGPDLILLLATSGLGLHCLQRSTA